MKRCKWLIAVLALVLSFGLAACGQNATQSTKATEFVTAVEAIEEVTLTDRQAISGAYKLYDDLTDADKQKSEVVSAKTNLDSKKAQYDALVANEAATNFLTVCGELPNADSVTRENRAIIEMAEALYESLGTAAKQVDGVAAAYEKLTAARKALDALIDTVKYIATADDFMAISEDLTGNYELTCDIDMSEKEWTVLGEFSGHLNGNGYTVKNINYTKQDSGFGIFQKVLSQGIVERLGVTGYVADAGDWAGVICVENYGTIRNCWTNVVLKSESACGYAGLIALKNMGNGVIENCYTIGANLGMGTEYSLSKGVLLLEKEQTAQENNVFALADNNEFALAIGNTPSSSSMLKTLAQMKQASLYSAWDTSIWNIQDGQLPALKTTDSGARLTQPEVYIVNTKESYSVSELSEKPTIQVKVAAIDCDFGKLSYTIKDQGSNVKVSETGVVTLPKAITSDLSFTVVVSLDENVSDEMTFTVSVPKNVVKISTAEQLLAIDKDLNGNYELIADIDLTGKTWTPLAAAKLNPDVDNDYTTKGFSGTFNGNGHTIKNFSFTPQYNGFALFNKINASAVVENVCIEATIDDAGSWIGGITVDNYGTIRNCLVKVTLKGSSENSYAGGICCNNLLDGDIENCVVLGSIKTTPWAFEDAGLSNGAFAVKNEGRITQCFALNTVTTYAVGNANVLGNLSSRKDGLKTEDEMKSVATYAGYDTNIWNIENGQYPALRKTA